MVVRRITALFKRSNQATSRGLLMAPSGLRSTRWGRRMAPISTSLALLALGLGLVCPAAGAEGVGPKSPSALAIPGSASAGAPPASEAPESLSQSIQRRQEFPFTPLCDGNTQEMVACLWQRRNHGDLRLRKLLGNEQELERWRATRLAVCRGSAERGAGGSIQPLLWLGCENALNSTLVEQITSPLMR
jgi:hypothetical protein